MSPRAHLAAGTARKGTGKAPEHSVPRRYPLREGKQADAGAPAPAPPLPCLYSNNSIERDAEEPSWNVLKGNHRKTALLLASHVERLVKLHGLETIGFLTLSFADHVTDAKEAGRRINSLLTNVIRGRYHDYIAVLERMKNRRIHFHLLVAIGTDIRTGFDFDAIKRKDYRSASAPIRAEWAFWRRTAPNYRFGRTELMPIKSNESAVSFYVGKYIRKHIEHRTEEDKGVRLVRTSFRAKAGTTRFAWNTASARLWREKIRLLAHEANLEETPEFGKVFGRHWMFRHQDIIQSVRPPVYWSESAANLDEIPAGFRLAVNAERFFREHHTLRMTPKEALFAIGARETRSGEPWLSRFYVLAADITEPDCDN